MQDPNHTPTPEQQAIFSAFSSPQASGHLEIKAGAGCGKTTTSMTALGHSPVPAQATLCLSFSKRDATELEKRAPIGTQCKTSNGLGHGAACKLLNGRVSLDKDKTYRLTGEHKALKSASGDTAFEHRLNIRKMTDYCLQAGLIPDNCKSLGYQFRSHTPDTFEAYEAIADHYMVDFIASQDVPIIQDIILASLKETFVKKTISFDDQILLPACFGAPLPTYPLVLVDEAQDLNTLRHKILARLVQKTGLLAFVGDPNQAIFGFIGALSNSMDLLAQAFPPAHRLPLMTTFRCPKEIVRLANQIVPSLVAAPSNPQGSVSYSGAWDLDLIPDGAAVLCRNNAPIVALAFALIRDRRSAAISGRDIGKGLEVLLKKLTGKKKSANLSRADLLAKLQAWEDTEVAKYPKRADRIEDRTACIRVLAESSRDSTEVLGAIKTLFSNPAASITLSTGHRAKGAEWKDVFILDEWLIGGRTEPGTWQADQEENLRYVLYTRSMQTLTFIDSRKRL